MNHGDVRALVPVLQCNIYAVSIPALILECIYCNTRPCMDVYRHATDIAIPIVLEYSVLCTRVHSVLIPPAPDHNKNKSGHIAIAANKIIAMQYHAIIMDWWTSIAIHRVHVYVLYLLQYSSTARVHVYSSRYTCTRSSVP